MYTTNDQLVAAATVTFSQEILAATIREWLLFIKKPTMMWRLCKPRTTISHKNLTCTTMLPRGGQKRFRRRLKVFF